VPVPVSHADVVVQERSQRGAIGRRGGHHLLVERGVAHH